MFEGEILQGSTHIILLRKKQNVIIKLKGLEYAQVDTNGNCRRTFLNASNCKWRAGRTFCYLSHTEIATQTCQLDVLTNSLHLLFKLSGKLCTHCCFAHNSIQFIFTNAKLQLFLYIIIC